MKPTRKPSNLDSFLDDIKKLSLTNAQLRCDIPPGQQIIELMDRYENYESLVIYVINTKKVSS